MENLILTPKEHKVLKKFQKRLQKRLNVKIQMPNLVTSTESDVIFATIDGETQSIERVKKFLSKAVTMTTEKVEYKESVLLVTLSDSDSEEERIIDVKLDKTIVADKDNVNNSTHLVCEEIIKPHNSSVCIIETPVKSQYSPNNTNEEISNTKESSICIIEEPVIITSSNVSKKKRKKYNMRNKKVILQNNLSSLRDDSICIIEDPAIVTSSNVSKEKRKQYEMKNKNVRLENNLFSPSFEDAFSCEVSSTTGEKMPKKIKLSVKATQKFGEFIPLHSKSKYSSERVESDDNLSIEKDSDDIIVIDKPLPVRLLRPIVIDGSNVAVEHGKITKTYSAKGIKLAVDYFLSKGHSQVTAFVPKFRRFCNRNFPTSSPEILDDLAKTQHVVFTPSRNLNGKCIVPYDDRFIVELACKNSGVIVSNDNYRDLVSESDSFKEVIENRLLMFCFVGDIFMVPSDPLGRNGPSLNEFLSFPPDSSS